MLDLQIETLTLRYKFRLISAGSILKQMDHHYQIETSLYTSCIPVTE